MILERRKEGKEGGRAEAREGRMKMSLGNTKKGAVGEVPGYRKAHGSQD